MKNTSILLMFILFLTPVTLYAQQSQFSKQKNAGVVGLSEESLRRQAANRMVPETLRNEYDELMTKMANGTLTVSESKRLEKVGSEYDAYSQYYYENSKKEYDANYHPMMGRMYYGDTMLVYPFTSHHNSPLLQGLDGIWILGSNNILLTVAFFTLIMLLAVLLTKLYFRSQKLHRDEGLKALRILSERYAHGEIKREDFLSKKKDLKI